MFIFWLPLVLGLRVMFYGESGAGKTSLIHRHYFGNIRGVLVNIGADDYRYGGGHVIWDLAGEAPQSHLFRQQLKPVDLAVVVFNLSEQVRGMLL